MVVAQLMKAVAAQGAEKDPAIRDGVLNELRHLMCLYLNDKLANPAGRDAVIR
jgi:hypothetical protein